MNVYPPLLWCFIDAGNKDTSGVGCCRQPDILGKHSGKDSLEETGV